MFDAIITVELADAPQNDLVQQELLGGQQIEELFFDDCRFKQPCENGATCIPSTDGSTFECRCVEGYTGKKDRKIVCICALFSESSCVSNVHLKFRDLYLRAKHGLRSTFK